MVVEASTRRIIDMEIHSVEIDLGKTSFHPGRLAGKGAVVVLRKSPLLCNRARR
jgi:hypothetical protein